MDRKLKQDKQIEREIKFFENVELQNKLKVEDILNDLEAERNS